MNKMDLHLFGVLSVFLFLLCSILAQNDGDIRLRGINSTATQGRVEVFYSGAWGTVCNDGFGVSEAIVVCRQIVPSVDPVNAQAVTDGRFGPGTADMAILMDDINCDGTETRLINCLFAGWGQTNCDHTEDVGVICPTAAVTSQSTAAPPTTRAPVIPDTGNCTTPDENIRIIGPSNLPGVGVVQVRRNGVWGGVCDNDWDLLDARVVCRMLCFDPTKALSGGVAFDTTTISEPMTIDNVECTGNEASITDCSQSAWTENICQRSEMAKVTCVELDNRPPSRPEPLLDCSNGMLSASFAKSRDAFLEEKHLVPALNYTGPCNFVRDSDEDFVSISIPFDECGTIRTSNATHIIYRNVIRYSPTFSTGPISNANTYMVHVKCELPRDVVADKPIRPLTETVTQVAPGEFVVNMHFYRNNSFVTAVTQFPLEIPLGEWLNTALQLLEVDSNLRLVVPNCYATPSANPNDPVQYPLFTEKCIDDQTVGFFPLNDTWFGYRMQTFRFVQFPEVYVHCDAYICEKNDTSPECDRSCFPATTSTASPGNRKKRSAGYRIVHVTSPTIVVYDSSASNEIIRPATTKKTTNVNTSARTTHNPPIVTRITSTPKITSQSQTMSSHMTTKFKQTTDLLTEGSNTESIFEEIFIADSGSSTVQTYVTRFMVVLILLASLLIRL